MAPPRTEGVRINIDGTISTAEDARVSAMDHGFLYGDSAYETLRTHHRRPFLLDPHLERLERSLERIFLAPPLARDALAAEIDRTVGTVPGDAEVSVRVVVSRGPGPLGLDIDLCTSPSFLVYVSPLADTPVFEMADPDRGGGGVALVISSVERNSPRALDPAIKSGNFLNNILAWRDAKRAGAHEALLLDAEGLVAEGTTSNVFAVRGGEVLTPRSHGILPGITRGVILEEARRAGRGACEADLGSADVLSADEVFISSSVRGIVPVASIDGRGIGSGTRGPVTHELQRLYRDRMDRECPPAVR